MRTLETLIRMLPGAIIVAAVLALIYQFSSATAAPELEGPPEAGGNGLAGWWEWVDSSRGGEVVRPVAATDSFVMILGAYGSYRERTAGGTLRGEYGFAEGTLRQTQDSLFTVLVLDTSNFFPRNGGIRAVAIRDMTANTLVLSGTGTDATVHRFVRAGQR